MNKLITRTLNAAKATNMSPKDKENLESQAKKIRGTSKVKRINPETANEDSISTAQLSYDNRIANVDTYIGQLASHPEYVPNETELTIPSLKTYNQSLKTLSSAVNASGNALITAQKNRNDILYNNPKNVMQLVSEIKAYLKSLGAAGAPYYKAFVKLKFRDISK